MCFVLWAKDFFLFYLFISKKSWLFGSNSFLNSETETTKDYTVYKPLSFRNSKKLAKILQNKKEQSKRLRGFS